MTKLYNRTVDKEKRRRLRNKMTEAEKILWLYLRNRQINGIKFRRQYSIGGFVIDFYCPTLKLAIEVDGGIHLKEDVKAYDNEREYIIKSLGVQLIRFTNDEIINKLNRTLKIIKGKAHNILASKGGK